MPATPAPPPPLIGLMATNRPGISASPQRTWAATLAVFRDAGIPMPRGVRWEYLPWDTPATEDGDTLDGVAYITRSTVAINPFLAAGDGRYLAGAFAHEAAHLASAMVDGRDVDDEAEEAAVEAVARDLVPVIRKRLRLDAIPFRGGAYQAQVNPLVRGTFRACRASMPRAKAARVERCARHTRRAFLLMDQANRAHALAVWGVTLPGIPPRDVFHEWVEANP